MQKKKMQKGKKRKKEKKEKGSPVEMRCPEATKLIWRLNKKMVEKYELPTYFLKELLSLKNIFFSLSLFLRFLSTWFPAGAAIQFCFWRYIRHIWENFCFVKFFPLILWNSLWKYLETICAVMFHFMNLTFFRTNYVWDHRKHFPWILQKVSQLKVTFSKV